MEKVKADNLHLYKTADAMDHMIEHIESDVSLLRDRDADQFSRFMAYNRIRTYLSTAQLVLKLAHASIMTGHTIQHESLQTDAAKEHEWNIVKAESHPFFIQGDNDDDIESTLKKVFAKHIVEQLFKRDQD